MTTTETESLPAIVARALERLAIPGIEGWGLVWTGLGLDGAYQLFDTVDVQPSLGCTSQTCGHNSHDAAAPILRLIPRAGTTLAQLGDEPGEDDALITWYVLTGTGAPRFFGLRCPRNYHATITEVDADAVPEWALARLAVEEAAT